MSNKHFQLVAESVVPTSPLIEAFKPHVISVAEARTRKIIPFNGKSDSLVNSRHYIDLVTTMEIQMTLMQCGTYSQFHGERSHFFCSAERMETVFKEGAKGITSPLPLRCLDYPRAFEPRSQWLEPMFNGEETEEYVNAPFEVEIWISAGMIDRVTAPIAITAVGPKARRKFLWTLYAHYESLEGNLQNHIDIIPYYRKTIADAQREAEATEATKPALEVVE